MTLRTPIVEHDMPETFYDAARAALHFRPHEMTPAQIKGMYKGDVADYILELRSMRDLWKRLYNQAVETDQRMIRVTNLVSEGIISVAEARSLLFGVLPP